MTGNEGRVGTLTAAIAMAAFELLGDGLELGAAGMLVWLALGEGAAGDADTAWSVACGAELNEIPTNEGMLGTVDAAKFELIAAVERELEPELKMVGVGVGLVVILALGEPVGDADTASSVACGVELNEIPTKEGMLAAGDAAVFELIAAVESELEPATELKIVGDGDGVGVGLVVRLALGEAVGDADTAYSVACGAELNEIPTKEGMLGAAEAETA